MDDETQTMVSSEPTPVEATKSCEAEPSGDSTVYDKDWLLLSHTIIHA